MYLPAVVSATPPTVRRVTVDPKLAVQPEVRSELINSPEYLHLESPGYHPLDSTSKNGNTHQTVIGPYSILY